MNYVKVAHINYFEVAIVEDILKNNKIEHFFKDSICKAHGFESVVLICIPLNRLKITRFKNHLTNFNIHCEGIPV